MRAVRVHAYGGPEVMRYEEVPEPPIGPHEVLLRIRAAGFNYADIMMRTGAYEGGPRPPFIPGFEVVGTVARVGTWVRDVHEGERFWAFPEVGPGSGGYAEYVAVPADRLLPMPSELGDREGAAFPIAFLTAYHALRTVGRLAPGETVLIHAAAGGVGTAAVQIAKALGGRVVATAGSPEKIALIRALGADVAINYREADFAEAIRAEGGGPGGAGGADLVLESVGGEVFRKSLECLKPFGRLVAYGIAGGEVPHANVRDLLFRNLSVCGFHLGEVMRRPDLLRPSLQELATWLRAGKIRPVLGQVFPLREAAQAHALVSARGNIGKVVLIPGDG